MIYDTFPFFNELDLLEIRMNILAPVVDKFVLVEATRTFTGKPKPLYYRDNKSRFEAFADKIIHVIVDDYPSFESPWTNENHQRNCLLRGLTDAKPEDRILLNDLDEIPRPELVSRYAREPGRFQFDLTYYSYFLNCRNVTDPHWKAAKLLSYSDLLHYFDNAKPDYSDMLLPAVNQGTTPTMIRRSSGFRAKTVPNGGWHFSSLGGGQAVIEKMTAFAHSEYDAPAKHDVQRIEEQIRSGKSPLYAIHSFAVPLDDSFPPFIVENKERFEPLLFPVSDQYLKETKWRRRYYSSVGRIKYTLRSLLPNSLLLFFHECRVKARTKAQPREITSSISARDS